MYNAQCKMNNLTFKFRHYKDTVTNKKWHADDADK
jgi:hypothetical protein